MKRRSFLLAFSALLLLTPSLPAADNVQLVGLENRVEAPPRLPAVFGHREETLNLQIRAAAIQSASVRADLFQVAGQLAMPLAKGIDLRDGLSLPDNGQQPLRVSLKFPEVKRRAEILVRLALVPTAPPSTPIPLGDLRFEVFPSSVTLDLAASLQAAPSAPARTVVFGPGRDLRQFLTQAHIPFADAGPGTPDRFDPDRFYFGDLNDTGQFQEAIDRGAGARLVLFSPDESLPDGIYASRTASGIVVHVTSPLLRNLATDPRAQLAFIKIIDFLSAPPPPSN